MDKLRPFYQVTLHVPSKLPLQVNSSSLLSLAVIISLWICTVCLVKVTT